MRFSGLSSYAIIFAGAAFAGCSSANSVPKTLGPNSGLSTQSPLNVGVAIQRRPLAGSSGFCPLAVGWPVPGNRTPDGDFDGAPMPPLSQGHVQYNGVITGTNWTATGAGIDLVNTVYWPSPPPAGNNVCKVDLDATPGDGGISETFNTVPGAVYHVKFWFSGSSAPPQGPVNTMQVGAANASQVYHWNTSNGHDVGHGIYGLRKFKFTATGCPTTLSFVSLDPPNWSSGPVVTEVITRGPAAMHC